MDTRTQLQFYRTLIRPIMAYPAIPLSISKTNVRRRQQFREASGIEERTEVSVSELYDKYGVKKNTRLYAPELLRNKTQNPHRRDHGWWSRIAPNLEKGPPDPDYAAVLCNRHETQSCFTINSKRCTKLYNLRICINYFCYDN